MYDDARRAPESWTSGRFGRAGHAPRLPGLLLIAAAGLALTAVAVAVTLSQPSQHHRVIVAIGHALVIAVPIAVGVYALQREPGNRFARLLVAAGFLWAPTLLTTVDSSVLYSIGRSWAWLVEVSLIYLVLAFPGGRLTTRLERAIVVGAAALVAITYLPTVPFVHQFPVPNPWVGCEQHCPPNALQVANSQPGFIDSVVVPVRETITVLLYLAAAGVLCWRVAAGSALMRRTLVPVLAFAIVRMVAAAAFTTWRHAAPWSTTTEVLGYIALLAIPALVLGFLLGLFRWRLLAGNALRRLSGQFAGPLNATRLRDLLAAALDDPSLAVAYWSDRPRRWVDDLGEPVVLPRDDPRRAITELSEGDHPVAALVHDAAHVSEPAVREIAGTFALMALQNQRLDAELRASLNEVQESRSRILSAVDRERMRIERDLHDGAQQRLVALRVGLEVGAQTVEDDPKAVADLLRKLGTGVDDALDEVRSLARGVYPPLLVDHGLREALRAAARHSSLSTTVSAPGIGRYSPEIESVVYFCCLETLQNAEKHSGASTATITLAEREQLEFEVTDDGHGFSPEAGTGAGMANMRDRLASVAGSLEIDSTEGEGTRILGRVPIAADQLGPDVELLLQRATDALQDCFGIYRAVRDSSGAVVDFVVEHVNDAACRDSGRAREAELGRTLGYLRPGYLESDVFEWHRNVLDSQGSSRREDVSYVQTALGRRVEKAYDVRGAPLGAGRVAIVWRDITDRKRVEHELRLQSAILAAAAEGVCLVRASDATIVYANPRLAQIFGYEPGELEGRHAAELHWAETPGEADDAAKRIFATVDDLGEAAVEVRGRSKEGDPIWCETRVSGFEHAEHGRVWVAMYQDVTGRKEAQLRAERFRQAFEHSPLAAFLLGPDLRFWEANSAFRHVVGYTVAELTLKAHPEITDPNNGGELAGLTRRLFSGELPNFTVDERYITKSGETVPATLSTVALAGRNGGPLWALGFIVPAPNGGITGSR